MYLVPPMDEEPPDDFVTFVAVHLADMQDEASRLTGGHGDEVYPDALADVARHWRRLRLRRRLTHRDTAAAYLTQRLTSRARHWREDQVYEVEVQILRPPAQAVRRASIALRKAEVLPGTVRVQQRPTAEAAIAWSHACRQARWHSVARIVAVVAIAFVALLQAMPSTPN